MMGGEFVVTSAPLAGLTFAELFDVVFVFFTIPDFFQSFSPVIRPACLRAGDG
jgi:hypothetical protein